jgi:predicted O-methyltransferase YrrM
MNVKAFVPRKIKGRIKSMLAERRYAALPIPTCDTRNLVLLSSLDFERVFLSPAAAAAWSSATPEIDALQITTAAGGVNPGDRRALFYLVHELAPQQILEIGTHIGASTVHIAAAMQAGAHLDTVDLHDCNSPDKWRRNGASCSPAELIERIGSGHRVTFHVRNSFRYLSDCEQRYDLIFLDGSHSSESVYLEVPAALQLLSPGGHILLHDYFPGGQPLWSNGHVGRGPYVAIERLKSEGARMNVKPLGALPWPTKLQSNVTSLAMLGRC